MNTTPNPFQEIADRLSRIENILTTVSKQKEPATVNPNDKFLRIQDAAEILKLSVPTLYGLVHFRTIPFFKRGKYLYFTREDLYNYLESGRRMNADEIKKATNDSLER